MARVTETTIDVRWGNPAHVTFAKNRIRLVAVDDLRVKVNRAIQPIVERLLTDLSARHHSVATLEGYPTVPLGDGIHLVVAGLDREVVARVLANYGLDADGEDVYRWRGSYDDALRVGQQLDEAIDAELASIPATSDRAARSEPSVTAGAPEVVRGPVPAPTAPTSSEAKRIATREDSDWDDSLPGSAPIEKGAIGRAVLFIQAYLDVARSGVYDEETVAAVRELQKRRGVRETGKLDTLTWREILPRLRPRLDAGEAGRHVRVLSAALVAAGEVDRGEVVHLRYGIALSRLVREFQHRHAMRVTGRTGGIEWGMLVGSPYEQEV